MEKTAKAAFLFLALWFLSPELFPQEGQNQTVPNALRRPEQGEAPRFPRDAVIGELGQEGVPEEASRLARNVLAFLAGGAGGAAAGFEPDETLREKVGGIKPRLFRLGSGRIEADGSVSFLLRFVGRDESIAGELFVRRAETGSVPSGEAAAKTETWILDDIILEEKKPLTEIRPGGRYDFSPYERFY